MAGTPEGFKKATATIKAKYGEDFFKNIGQKGGSVLVPKGFALDRERARWAGQKGGRISRRAGKV